MKASFAVGADALELDVHPTTDGQFAVFHDWTLECRTNGHGVTREQSMSYLRTLDVGYGYTADGGKNFPFRGKGVGMIKTLDEVLRTFPGKQFLINIKSNDPHESELLVSYLRRHGHPTNRRLWVFADGPAAAERLRQLAPDAMILDKARVKSCSARYLAVGWTGYVPSACRGGVIGVPKNLRWAFWGWPNRFLQRMRGARVLVWVSGSVGADEPFISRPRELKVVPPQFDGYVVTDDIETIGSAARRRWKSRS